MNSADEIISGKPSLDDSGEILPLARRVCRADESACPQTERSFVPKLTSGFSIFIDTVYEGRIPAWHDEKGLPVVYPTIEAAQHEIADDMMEKLRQFLEGERDFEDAMEVEDYILPVNIFPDGSIVDLEGNRFGKKDY